MVGGNGFGGELMAWQIFCRGESKNGQNYEAGQAWELLS
jgi:hypothetical protein